MKKDNYVISAIRHSLDGDCLLYAGRNHGAMGHYGFAVECFVKVLYKQITGNEGRTISHDMEQIYQELSAYYRYICFEDAKTDLMLKVQNLPRKLVNGHPQRRYWNDITYTEEELQETRELVERMRKELVGQVLDGRISIND